MRPTKVLRDFAKFPVLMLVEFVRIMVAKMTGNSNFVNPDVALTELSAGADELETDHQNADDGSRYYGSLMRASKKMLIKLLRKQAAYVERIADGDESIILSSGYHPTRQPMARAKDDFWVLAGAEHGHIVMGARPIKYARSYVWMYSMSENPAGEEGWIYGGTSTQASSYITGLESGKCVWFRCCGITKNGPTPWCKPIFVVVP